MGTSLRRKTGDLLPTSTGSCMQAECENWGNNVLKRIILFAYLSVVFFFNKSDISYWRPTFVYYCCQILFSRFPHTHKSAIKIMRLQSTWNLANPFIILFWSEIKFVINMRFRFFICECYFHHISRYNFERAMIKCRPNSQMTNHQNFHL